MTDLKKMSERFDSYHREALKRYDQRESEFREKTQVLSYGCQQLLTDEMIEALSKDEKLAKLLEEPQVSGSSDELIEEEQIDVVENELNDDVEIDTEKRDDKKVDKTESVYLQDDYQAVHYVKRSTRKESIFRKLFRLIFKKVR